MKNWFRRFMAGRYGFDQFSAFLSVGSLVCILLGTWFSAVLYWGGLALLAYCYYRTLSRNFYQRRAENSADMDFFFFRRTMAFPFFSQFILSIHLDAVKFTCVNFYCQPFTYDYPQAIILL